MNVTDPLAAERFRTILAEAARSANWDPYSFGDDSDPYVFASQIVSSGFSDAHFEYRTNEHGVRVRRVVVAGEWETDPSLPDANCVTLPDGACASTEPCMHTAHVTSAPPSPARCPGTARNGTACHAEPGHKGGHRASFPA